MVEVKYAVKYPCGLEFKLEAKSWFATNIKWDDKSKIDCSRCPIHGKKCREVKNGK